MPTYKLKYFDTDGGRGEPIRIALHAGGIPFEDVRLAFPAFAQARESLPFRCVPVLEIDGQPITQSTAILRYVGKLTDLYPRDPLQALYCDEVMDAVEDATHHTVRTFGLQGDALKQAREQLVAGWLTTYVQGVGRLLERGGDHVADGSLTIADVKLFVWVRSLTSGRLDHVPTDLVDRLAPNLRAHHDRVAKDPRVVAYYNR